MMVREIAVHFEEQLGNVDIELFENTMHDGSGRSVARVGHHFDAAIEMELRRRSLRRKGQ